MMTKTSPRQNDINLQHSLEDEKFFFLHIPKTAGTSLRKLVDHYYPYPQGVHIYERMTDADAAAYEELKKSNSFYGHFGYGLHNRMGVAGKYIAFLRDPAERVISYYNHQARVRETVHHQKIAAGVSLVELMTVHKEPQMSNHMVRLISGTGVDRTSEQDYFEPLKIAIRNIDNEFLFVGLVEDLSNSMRVLSELLGWSKRHHNLPISNVNPDPKTRLVDENVLRQLRAYNRLDYMLYEHVRWRLRSYLEDNFPHIRLQIIHPKQSVTAGRFRLTGRLVSTQEIAALRVIGNGGVLELPLTLTIDRPKRKEPKYPFVYSFMSIAKADMIENKMLNFEVSTGSIKDIYHYYL